MNTLKKAFIITFRIVFFTVCALAVIGVAAFFIVRSNVDYKEDEALFDAAKSTSVTHFYANSSLDGDYRPVEIEATAFGAAKKVWYPINEVSDYVKMGFIAAEDREFYSHSGVNFRRSFGAFLNYVFKSHKRYGASTITQQVVKNISGDNELSAKRKLYEMLRALEIEKNHTKDEILELYMNIVPMSDNIVGVGYAADRYFGKEPSELTLAEAATVVGITNSPVRYDPRTNPENCKLRRNTVLSAMLDMGFITEDECARASAEEIVLQDTDGRGGYSSWFVETVISDVIRDLAREYKLTEAAARLKLMRGGYNIYTTENPDVQSILESVFEDVDSLPAEFSSGLGIAMCINDSKTGNLLATVGSAGKKEGNRLLNLADVPHPPGSTLKPLALYAPLLNDKRINWASVFDDTPAEFHKNGDVYTEFPQNSPRVYDGLTTVADALRLSKNTVAVRLYGMLGKRRIFDTLKNGFGFDTLVERASGYSGTVSDLDVSPLALGQLSYGVKLRALTAAYTVFPREGIYSGGVSYLFVKDKDGNTVLENRPVTKRMFTPSTARIMNQLLMNVVLDGTARSVSLKHKVDTAGKTGTTSDSRDKLFVGYTPYFTAGIWCGYPDKNDSVGSLSPSHIEIWDRVMNRAHDLVECDEHFSVSGLVRRDFCKDSGDLPDAVCSLDPRGERIESGYFTPDNLPKELCGRHILCKYDTTADRVVPDWYFGEGVISISLIDTPKRDFPKEIKVGDADYSYEKHKTDVPPYGAYPFFTAPFDDEDEEKENL